MERPDAEPIEGRDGKVVAYRERLVPPVSWWLLAFALAASIGIAYGHFLGATVGWLTTIVVTAILFWLLWSRAAPLVRVDELVLRAGPARLPLAYVGDVRILDAAATVHLRDTQVSAHLCLRPAVTDRAVAVVVTDPDDPHPFWLVSTRRPEVLADALTAARNWHP